MAAAAAISSVLALCSSLDAATSCIAAANDSVPVASESSLARISRANPFAMVTAVSIDCRPRIRVDNRFFDLPERARAFLRCASHGAHRIDGALAGAARLRDAIQHAAHDALRALCGVRRHRGETSHFFGDDGEAMAMIARTSCFHRRVEREELRLPRELLHERHEASNFFRRLRELIDRRGIRLHVAGERRERSRALIEAARGCRARGRGAWCCARRPRARLVEIGSDGHELLRRAGERLDRLGHHGRLLTEIRRRVRDLARPTLPSPPSSR